MLRSNTTEQPTRPFVVRLAPDSNLYWKTEKAWVCREEAEVFTGFGPDLSIGHRVYLDEEQK